MHCLDTSSSAVSVLQFVFNTSGNSFAGYLEKSILKRLAKSIRRMSADNKNVFGFKL